jgi:transcription initiation factor TFIID subunit TAF12
MQEKKMTRKREIKWLNEELDSQKEAAESLLKDYKKLSEDYEKLMYDYNYVSYRMETESSWRINYYQQLCKAKTNLISLAIYATISTVIIIYLLIR